MFVRHDQDFISAEKYTGNLMISGEIGMIANTRVVPSKRVPLNEEIPEHYVKCASGDTGALKVIASGTPSASQVLLSALGDMENVAANDYVKLVPKVAAGTYYINPIVKLEGESDTEDETPALTIYLKRDTNVETQRQSLKRVTDISVDKFYTVVLSNAGKLVLAKFKA